MPTGTIKKLVSDRGFGFIKAEDGQEYFFHRSGTEGDFDGLQGGEKVSFEIESSPKGPRAQRVLLHEQDRGPVLVDLLDGPEHLVHHLRRQAERRLVEQQEPRSGE